MKAIALTAALAFTATSALAGSGGPTVMMDKPVEVMAPKAEAPGSGAVGWLIPLIAIAAIALASD